jgi:hypothetical protein
MVPDLLHDDFFPFKNILWTIAAGADIFTTGYY